MASSIALNPPFNKSMCRSLFCSFRERKRRGVTAARNVPNSRGSRGGVPWGTPWAGLAWACLGLGLGWPPLSSVTSVTSVKFCCLGLGWPGMGLPGPGPGLASVKSRYFSYFR